MTENCTNPESGELLAPYELGLLSNEDRARFEEHLAECGRCADDLFDLAPVMTAAHTEAAGIERALGERVDERAARGRGSRGLRAWAAPLAGLAAAAVLLVVLTGDDPDYASLAHLTPAAYVPFDTRGETDDRDALFQEAMSLYTSEQYAAAIPLLENALSPADSQAGWRYTEQARFYLGVSQLLTRDTARAEITLRTLLDSKTRALHERARWYLAQVALVRNDRASAETHLRALSETSPVYAGDAAALLAAIEVLE